MKDKRFNYNIRTIKADGVDYLVRKYICADTLPRIGETVTFWCKEEDFRGFKSFKVVDVKHTLLIDRYEVKEIVSIYI